ncbi:hypothetical protein GCM10023321_54420 [Pseudonocardia eucalypti]|uniref:SRPBCC family protein n=1 Tax=Pseudonocardia eucalypti TaxID=648755 RepID=A0ABP9QNR3_9PSEU|nr:hypothetical protein [Pseudonocardia eucalypti]
MQVLNTHVRVFPGGPERAGALIDSLATAEDGLWPHERWPAMEFDRPLGIGADGGHGPIGYRVAEYRPSRRVRFAFTRPAGFHGYHEWEVRPVPGGHELRHVLEMDAAGLAVLSWPVIWRPMHDALIEDALDKAAALSDPRPWSRWVRLLRLGYRTRNRISV